MTDRRVRDTEPQFPLPAVSDADVIEAMREIGGYFDITPGDLKEVLKAAYRLAARRIFEAVRAGDIMTRGVHSVTEDAGVEAVVEIMAEHGISGVPVVDISGKVAGIVSEKDIIERMGLQDGAHIMRIIFECIKGKSSMGGPIRTLKAFDIMTSPAITVGEHASLFELTEIFDMHRINRAPVVDGYGILKGIISRADIIKAHRQLREKTSGLPKPSK